jgi:hypothetical protein
VQKSAQELEAVLHEVGQAGVFLAHRLVVPPAGYAAALEGELFVVRRRVKLRVALLQSFPASLPHIYLLPRNALGFIPHVLEESGYVCLLDSEGMIINRDQPAAVVVESIRRTVQLLEDGVQGTNRADFVDEFEVQWSRLADGIWMTNVLDPGPAVRSVATAQTSSEAYVAADESGLSSYRNGNSIPRPLKLAPAVYLPLEPGTMLVPPREYGAMWTVAEARQKLLAGLSEENAQELSALLGVRKYYGPQDVIVSLPRPSGGTNLFGIRFEGADGAHPLRPSGTAKRAIPINLRRREKSFLVPRGGADQGLGAKRVLLVGCGAVGGYIALELARAGILHLTLVDRDHLSSDNTFRHVLGQRYWGANKAEALKQEIEANLPYVRVRAIPRSLEVSIGEGSDLDLVTYDIVICALGNPTVELAFNEFLHDMPSAPKAVFTWVEPFGIGGNALLAGNPAGRGCFHCLYTVPGADETGVVNRASFAVADPARPFGRAISGCGSLHTPYGSLDAVRTAGLATRLALDALTGAETGNPLRSWKGDPAAYLSAGFALSKRFAASEDQLHRLRYEYRSPECPMCSPKRGELE